MLLPKVIRPSLKPQATLSPLSVNRNSFASSSFVKPQLHQVEIGYILSTRINHVLAVVVNGKQLENVRCAKLLGLEIDHELTFIPHVEKLSKKLSQRMGILKRIKYCLPLKHRLIFYNTMIRPVIDYVNVVWTNCDKHCLNRVVKLQKRAARVILDADCQASSVKLFNKLNWIPFFSNRLN